MSETECIPETVNIELWRTVTAKLSNYRSLFDAFDGDDPGDTHSVEAIICNMESEDNSESHDEALPGRSSKRKSSSSEQLKVCQRRLLMCLKENPAGLNHLLLPQADLQVLTTNRSLVVPEETFQQACLQAIGLEEEHVGWVAQYILLPEVSQLSGPLPHPSQQQLASLVEQHPTVLTTSCLCPALRWGSSYHTDQLVASLLDRLPTIMMTQGAALLGSLTSRQHLGESALVVVESVGVGLPPASTPSSFLTAEAVVTALVRLCDVMPTNSYRMGRVLLRLTHMLTPYLTENVLRRLFAQTVAGHSSPLQRPIKMQLAKIAQQNFT